MLFKINLKNRKKIKIILLPLAFLLLLVFLQHFEASAGSVYQPMERIPGFPTDNTSASQQYKTLVEGIYKFGIWTVGIAALLMITIGGFMYMTSAGNTAKAGSAKGIIWDAIYGLIVALFAWILLNVINPDLVNVSVNPASLSSLTSPNAVSPSSPNATPPTSTRSTRPSQPAANCSPVTLAGSSATVANLQNTCFKDNAEKMSRIAQMESGGDQTKLSLTDRCADNRTFSVGLYQINIIAHAKRLGYNPSQIFQVDSATAAHPEGRCLNYTQNSSGFRYCEHRDCKVINEQLYNQLVSDMQNGQNNIKVACEISNNGNNIRPAWVSSANRCGL